MKQSMIITLFLSMTLILSACGAANENTAAEPAPETDSVTETPQAESTEAVTDTPTPSETPTEVTETPSPTATPTAASETSEAAAPVDEKGDIILVDDVTPMQIGTPLSLSRPDGDYTLTVTEAALTDERANDIPAARVLRVSYRYDNQSCQEGLLIGELSFALLDEGGNNLSYYVFDYSQDTNPIPELIDAGESCEVALGFALPDDAHQLKLVFIDAEDPSYSEYVWDISV